MKKGWIIILVVVAGAGLFCMVEKTKLKIAYVRSSDLIYDYKGMKEAQKVFQEKSRQLQSNVDTLQSDFQKAVSNYNLEYHQLTAAERLEREKFLSQQESNLTKYSQTISAKTKQEEEKMTQSVLNQINSFVEEYGKKNKYDIVLGTTSSGNVLYGNSAMDITKELLKELNENYQPKVDSL